MKKIITYINCILLFALIMNVGYAQTESRTQDPKILNDLAVSTRLQKDLNNRNAMTVNQPVSWWDSGYGYYGSYTIDSTTYITRYDKQGNYLETLKKREWNDIVSASVTSSFDKSPYKDHQVTSYWEVTDPNRKGYYFELSDKGKTQRVWLNDKYSFSTTPYTIPPAPKPIN